jgi:hypothetical protein
LSTRRPDSRSISRLRHDRTRRKRGGFRCIGIERELEYLEIAKGRLMATPMGLGLDVPAPTQRRAKLGKDTGGGTHCSFFPGKCEGHPGHGKYGPTIHVQEEPAA